jgi:DNA-binding FadR family transcriptional regulator
MFFMIVTRPSDVVSYPEQHRTLLEAICSQDLKRAEQTAIKHVVDAALLALTGQFVTSMVQESVNG